MKRNETKAYERTPSVGCSHGIQRGGSSMSIQRGGSEKDGTWCFYTGMGTAHQCVRLDGDCFPVTCIRTGAPAVTRKKRARTAVAAQ